MADDLNTAIGAALRRTRERSGLSQTELARRMHDQGHTWHQTTVGRVESGDRPLRLDEAAAVSGVLAIPIGGLFEPPDHDKLETLRKEMATHLLAQARMDRQRLNAEARLVLLHESLDAARRRSEQAQQELESISHQIDQARSDRAAAVEQLADLTVKADRARAEFEQYRGQLADRWPDLPGIRDM